MTFIMTIMSLIIVCLIVLLGLIINYCNYLTSGNGDKNINYYYGYFKKNENTMNEMVNFMIKNQIECLSKSEQLYNDEYIKAEVNNIYIYSINDVKDNDLSKITNSFSKTIINDIYLSLDKNYYVFVVYSSGFRSVTYKYFINSFNADDEIETEKKGNLIRYDITIKIDDNWEFDYNTIGS